MIQAVHVILACPRVKSQPGGNCICSICPGRFLILLIATVISLIFKEQDKTTKLPLVLTMTVAERRLTMRVATAADIPPLLALVRSAYRGEASLEGWTTEAGYLADERIDEAGLLAKIEEPNTRVLMFSGPPSPPSHRQQQQKDELLACCEIARLPDPSKRAYFGLFAVNPKLQNGGIGRKVLGEAEKYAREQFGADRMEMLVVWLREELIAWYVRRGYKLLEEQTRPFPYEHLVNGKALRDDLYFIVLEKELV